MNDLFDEWFGAVGDSLYADRTSFRGWGLVERYEAKRRKRVMSHEHLIQQALERRFRWSRKTYPAHNHWHCDGSIARHTNDAKELWYELKTFYVPHFHSRSYPHNGDYERLFRFAHPSGALSDVARLKEIAKGKREAAFLVIALSWAAPQEAGRLASYEAHRELTLRAFRMVARLPRPQCERVFRGQKPWSCVIQAWRIRA